MKREWLRTTGRFNVGKMAGSEDCFTRLPGDEKNLGGAVMSVLSAGDRVVAIEIGFLQNRHYYGHLGTFDWEFADCSPGKVQIELTIRWLIDHGVRSYDFLANATEYKRSWSNRSEPLKSFAVPFSFKGRIYAEAWLPNLKPTIKRAYYAMPAWVRRLVTGVQSIAAALFG
jgi:CelD/BcsL family acetyltransferase involved in cellulose biosynthesis